MSLLLKALEKAAQDRGQRETAAVAPTATTQVLGLEPLPARAPADLTGSSQTQSSDAQSSNAPVDYRSRGGALRAPQLHAQSRAPAQVAAAGVLQAQGSAAGGANRANGVNGVVEWLRARPVYALGGLAGLFLVCYGAYVYVQIFHPGLLQRTPVRANPALVNAPAPAPALTPPPSQARITIPDALSRDTQEARDAEKNDAPPPAMVAAAAAPVTMASAATTAMSREGAGAGPARAASPATSSAMPSAIPPASLSASPSAQLISPPARIAVNRADSAQPRVNPLLAEAYAALERGQLEAAQRLYNQALRAEPNSVDALLGLAAIAQAENRAEDAQRHFMAVLEVDPRNALAQSGLINQSVRADPAAAETRLKQLIAREPSAPLHFSLGNLYADQGLWPQAQQAYFQAHAMDARNPDYAYNLAVGLEHLGQPKLAMDFYRKAVALAVGRGVVNFDTARAEERIARLAARQVQ